MDTRNGVWEYFRCPASDCFVVCNADNVEKYYHEFNKQVNNYWLATFDSENVCYCHKPFIFKISKSEKNPDRMYFNVRENSETSFNGLT